MTALAQRRMAGATALMILLYLLQVALLASGARAIDDFVTGPVPDSCVKFELGDTGMLSPPDYPDVEITLVAWHADRKGVDFTVSGLVDDQYVQLSAKAGVTESESDPYGNGSHTYLNAVKYDISNIRFCVFEGAPPPPMAASLTVEKAVVVSSGSPATTSFDFAVTGEDPFSLVDGGSKSFSYLFDSAEDTKTITITEQAIAETGWATSISCGAEGGSNSVEVTVGPGDDITCTVTNTFRGETSSSTTLPAPPTTVTATGTVVIEKVTTAVGDGRAFVFTFDGERFALADGESQTFSGLAAGNHVAAEVQGGAANGISWAIESLSCVDLSGGTIVFTDLEAEVDAANATANIDLAAGETVICTFTNAPTEVLGVTITVTTTPEEVSADTLPFTGFESGDTVKLGLLALLAGVLMLFAVRGPKEEEAAATDIGRWPSL